MRNEKKNHKRNSSVHHNSISDCSILKSVAHNVTHIITRMTTPANAARARSAKAKLRDAKRRRAAVGRAGYTRKAQRGERCAICMRNVTAITRTTLGCTHPLHQRCLYRWLRYHTNCPVCRYNFARTIPRSERRQPL
ncbi:hypothetical protein niasHS_010243 [Heterodera schachtii]|uniref:RING-type domain-containing protein n=1 Tax=Heterodera schachtii TaxID=97005 RepID=A0ABD2IZ60_HETSC